MGKLLRGIAAGWGAKKLGGGCIIVDPGVPLQPGRRVECVLLPGIVDADGIPLRPRDGKGAADFVEVLRYQVEGTEPGTRGLDPARRRGSGAGI